MIYTSMSRPNHATVAFLAVNHWELLHETAAALNQNTGCTDEATTEYTPPLLPHDADHPP
jgi:hypothetical protein